MESCSNCNYFVIVKHIYYVHRVLLQRDGSVFVLINVDGDEQGDFDLIGDSNVKRGVKDVTHLDQRQQNVLTPIMQNGIDNLVIFIGVDVLLDCD